MMAARLGFLDGQMVLRKKRWWRSMDDVGCVGGDGRGIL